jgi:hypothetical protein
METQVYKVRDPSGNVREIRGPAGASDADIIAQAQQLFSVERPSAVRPSSTFRASPTGSRVDQFLANLPDIQGSGPARLIQGAGLLPMGVTQLGAKAVGAPDRAGEVIQQTETLRNRQGSDGIDWWQTAGAVLSPANLALARALPAVTSGMSALRLGGAGAAAGGASGALTPVSSADDFVGSKVTQTLAGTLLGGATAPVATRAGEAVSRAINRRTPPAPAAIASQVDQAIKQAFADIRQDPSTLSIVQLDQLRKAAADSLRQGKKLDLAAALRADDFNALGIPFTRGQITRDPMQWADEQNLRGIAGVGRPITTRLMDQRRAMGDILHRFSGGAAERADGGMQIAQTLEGVDKQLGKGVRALYTTARKSAQKDLDIPLQGFSQDVARVVSEYGDAVPSGVMNQIRDLGLLSGRQLRVFTLEDADKLSKVINKNYSFEPAVKGALDTLRAKLREAVEASVPNADNPFFPAVRAAAERFALRDAVPALRIAAQGGANEDTFIQQFFLNGRPTEVQNLAKLLKANSPDAYEQARQQIGAYLNREAFGMNQAGDKAIAPERFAKALNKLGTARLKGFFAPEEIDQFRRLGRVAAYIGSEPAGSAPNRSNTAAAMANAITGMGGRIPGIGMAANAGKALSNAVVSPVVQARQVDRALSGVVPSTTAPLTEQQQRLLRALIVPGVIGATGAASLD